MSAAEVLTVYSPHQDKVRAEVLAKIAEMSHYSATPWPVVLGRSEAEHRAAIREIDTWLQGSGSHATQWIAIVQGSYPELAADFDRSLRDSSHKLRLIRVMALLILGDIEEVDREAPELIEEAEDLLSGALVMASRQEDGEAVPWKHGDAA